MNEILGWIGNVFFLWGVYALGKKDIKGFHSNIIGNVLYAVQAILMNNMSLLILCIGLVILNIKGILEWGRQINYTIETSTGKKEYETS